MEIKQFFDIQLKRDERGIRFFKLNMHEDIKDTMGNPPLCQKCKGMLGLPFWICEEYYQWFCKDCQLETGRIKEPLCKDDEIDSMYDIGTIRKEDHIHICIKGTNKDDNTKK